MAALLELKEKLARFYMRNEVFITPFIRFLAALVAFLMINSRIGYMEKISRTSVALLMALLCSVLPVSWTVFLASVVILLDLYALSLEVCAVALVLFLLMYFLYFRFVPGNGYGVLLTPICFGLRIPYVLPLGMGLLKGLHSLFAFACGTVAYFFLDGVRQNATLLSAPTDEEEAVSKIVVVINQLASNREMYLVLAIMAATLLIVYVIRRLPIENSWTAAIISGVLFESVGLVAGYMLLGIEGKTVEVLAGSAAACLFSLLLQFLFFNLDYSRTERLQFEDDEYYYYVKAVPKAAVSGKDKKVKRFSGRDAERMSKKAFAEELEIEEEWLD